MLVPLLIIATTTTVSQAALERRAERVRERVDRQLGGQTFHVLIEHPFVVVGDGPRSAVARRATGTIRWAVARLREAYFERAPRHAIVVWLFEDDASYRRNTWLLFGHRPATPYGYYDADERALIMNIGTGGGTLVHEMVHPYIEANFPSAPPWLNEGLASLYEHAAERDGAIVGRLNWRLAGLQQDIRAGVVPSFRRLLALDEDGFYGPGSGTHYAQARYLLYYLQQEGLLHAFYRRFLRVHTSDPTGIDSLRHILGRRDLRAFQRQWERWILSLSRTARQKA